MGNPSEGPGKRTTIEQVGWWSWLALLVVIPVSSSSLIASFSGGETPVSPLSILPLGGVVLFGLLPFVFKRGELPGVLWPLFVFALFSILSAIASTRLDLIPFKGQTALARTIRAMITMIIGYGFYLSAVTMPRDERELRLSLRALYLGLFAALTWSAVQAWFILQGYKSYPGIVLRIHQLISVRDPVIDRVTGMAFEPSWFGDQLVVLYLPLLLASVVQRRSVFRSAPGWMSPELVILIISMLMLLLTKSRISFLSLFAMLSLLYFFIGFRWLYNRRLAGWKDTGSGGSISRRLLLILGGLTLVGIWALTILGSGWVLSQADERLASLTSAPRRLEDFAYFYPNEAGFELANNLAFAERIMYWTVGMRTFSTYPLLGVGPGNTGFFFERFLPPYGFQLVEIQNVLKEPLFGFPNPKNFWIRLFAETGILGFSTFFIWYLLSWLRSAVLWVKSGDVQKVIGLAGVLGGVAFFVEGFSLDTFALPQFWIIFGLVASYKMGSDDQSID